jgi:hypothetical protein
MADGRPLTRTFRPDDRVPANASPGLMRAEFDTLVTELQQLRSTHHARTSIGKESRVRSAKPV